MGANDMYQAIAGMARQSAGNFTKNGVDFILMAMNACFKYAEQNHDWFAQESVVTCLVDQHKGGDLLNGTFQAYDKIALANVTLSTGSKNLTCTSTTGVMPGALLEDWVGGSFSQGTTVVSNTNGTTLVMSAFPLLNQTAYGNVEVANPVTIKNLDCVYYVSEWPYVVTKHALIPVELNTKKSVGIWIKERIRKLPRFSWQWRYPADNMYLISRRMVQAYVHGTRLFFDPPFGPPNFQNPWVCSVLDVEAKFPVWAASDISGNTPHWMFDEGWEFILWKSLCILNPLAMQFVLRAEGFLPPPEKDWQAAFMSMVSWDDSRYETAMEGNHQH